MKKYLLFIVLMSGLTLLAQDLRQLELVGKAEKLSSEIASRRDRDGNMAAAIQVLSDMDGFSYDSYNGVVGNVDSRPGMDIVYVQTSERVLEIYKTGYEPLQLILSELGIYLQPRDVWRIRISGDAVVVSTSDLVRVTFRMNESQVYIRSGDNAPVMSTGNTAVFNVPKGTQRFRFIKEGFEEFEVSRNIQNDEVIEVSLEPGVITTTLTLNGWIIVSSEPTGAEVYLNEQRVGVTPYQGRHLAGDYNLLVRIPMYYDHNERFTLDEGATVDLPKIDMKPRFGHWEVSSTPTGAEVLLDGRAIGTTPLERSRISSGQHTLIVRKDLYNDYEEQFLIQDGDEKQVTANLSPAFGELVINSEPSGAKVFLDGKEVGTTPYRNPQQASGTYSIKLTKSLYSDALDEAVVTDTKTTERFIALSQNFGVLEVSAPGARILIDGEEVGTGSYTANLAPGAYQVKALKDRHYDGEKEVFVVLGQTEKVVFDLKAKQGALSVVTNPFEARGAEILINNERRKEQTPAVIPLLVGDYTVKVRKDGYVEQERRINISEGKEETLMFDLQTYEGSMAQQIRQYKNAKMIYGAATLVSAAAGAYLLYSSDQLAKEYPTATTDATSIYDRMEQQQTLSYVAFGVAVPLGVMYLVKGAKLRKARNKVQLTAMPVEGGGVVGLLVSF
jgi:hypothetical protein